MPGLQWPFVLAPLPPRKRKPVQPGFTAEELLYLQEVLAVIDSMHESDVTQVHEPEPKLTNHHAPSRTISSRSSSSSSPASSSLISTLRSRIADAKLWVFTHPSMLGIFFAFLAALLLSYSPHHRMVSVGSLLGACCLAAGLKLLVVNEGQALRLDPEHEETSVIGKERGRARGRESRSSRRYATTS